MGAGAAAATLATPGHAQWQPSPRYPDPSIKIVDPTFAKYRVGSAKVERLGTGYRWCEGPVWFGDGRYLLWSDIPNDRIMKWEEETGAVSVFRKPSSYANGNTRDRQGRLLTCEHDARRVTRTEYDGRVTVIADGYEGKPLNSPNDIVCRSDGSIWFTDPPFGVLGYYEGHVARPELPTNVYRVDPQAGRLAVVAGDVNRPNGLAFSCLQPRRQADRTHRPARALRQRLLRRPAPQPALHVREHVAVLALREHAGRAGRLGVQRGVSTTGISTM